MAYKEKRRWVFNNSHGVLQVAFGDHWLELTAIIVCSAIGGIALGYIWRSVHIVVELAQAGGLQ